VAAASVLFHARTKLVSDAADFDRGVDRAGTHGGSGVLVAMMLAGVVGWWCLPALLSLPAAVRNSVRVVRAREAETAELAAIDVDTARVHCPFGVLLSVGLLLSA